MRITPILAMALAASAAGCDQPPPPVMPISEPQLRLEVTVDRSELVPGAPVTFTATAWNTTGEVVSVGDCGPGMDVVVYTPVRTYESLVRSTYGYGDISGPCVSDAPVDVPAHGSLAIQYEWTVPEYRGWYTAVVVPRRRSGFSYRNQSISFQVR